MLGVDEQSFVVSMGSLHGVKRLNYLVPTCSPSRRMHLLIQLHLQVVNVLQDNDFGRVPILHLCFVSCERHSSTIPVWKHPLVLLEW